MASQNISPWGSEQSWNGEGGGQAESAVAAGQQSPLTRWRYKHEANRWGWKWGVLSGYTIREHGGREITLPARRAATESEAKGRLAATYDGVVKRTELSVGCLG